MTSGKITNLYSLEDKDLAKSGETPLLQTYNAFLLDSRDYKDDKAYIYASFLKDKK